MVVVSEIGSAIEPVATSLALTIHCWLFVHCSLFDGDDVDAVVFVIATAVVVHTYKQTNIQALALLLMNKQHSQVAASLFLPLSVSVFLLSFVTHICYSACAVTCACGHRCYFLAAVDSAATVIPVLASLYTSAYCKLQCIFRYICSASLIFSLTASHILH